ncbi:MAG TPA: sugar phosphate isomerase/epimerase family protein [Chryseolinea sp.]
MKFALLSVTYSGLFYAGKALTLEQQIQKAKAMGFEALAIETKRPIGSPLDLTKKDRERLKAVADGEGIALCALESMSNFCSRHMEERENNLAMMRMVLEMAKDLNIDKVKIFAAWPGIINDEELLASYAPYERGNYFKVVNASDLRVWNRAITGIREVTDLAADMGITILLQNHAPVLNPGYEDTLAMLQEIDRKNLKLCMDVPLFSDRQKTEYVREAVDKCAEYIQYTHYGAWNFTEDANGEIIQEPAPYHGGKINYEAFLEGLYQHGYDGYLVSEYCLPMIRNHQIMGVEEIDKATERDMRYVKQLLNKISVKKTGSQRAALV